MGDHHTFFGKLIFKIQSFIVLTFGSEEKAEAFLLQHADQGIEVFGHIRDLLKSKGATQIIEGVESFTPDAIDTLINNIRAAAIDKVERVIERMQEGKACLSLPTFPERLKCFLEMMHGKPADTQDALIFKGASIYTQESAKADGQAVKMSMSDTAVQTQLYSKKIDLGTA